MTAPRPGSAGSAQRAASTGCTRRALVTGACLVAAGAVTGCSGVDRSAPRGEAEPLAGPTSDIPIQGGTVFREQKVVVTQPSAGVFHAFSSACTHQGCTVQGVVDGAITCPCHGSRFDSTDGSVLRGPAEQPLPRRQITVEGTSFTVAPPGT